MSPSPSISPTTSRHRCITPGAESDVIEAADNEEDDAADRSEDCAEEGGGGERGAVAGEKLVILRGYSSGSGVEGWGLVVGIVLGEEGQSGCRCAD